CQLLTLVGPGGSGKTRLAIEIAGRKLEDFPNGVYLVPLAPLSSADNIVPSIAHSVTLDLGGGDDPRQGLLDYLRHNHLLLVLDNFEHLLAGAELVADILNDAPEVKILVTSREALNLQEEWVRQVNGMRFPDTEVTERIEDFSAVKLFVERARRVR